MKIFCPVCQSVNEYTLLLEAKGKTPLSSKNHAPDPSLYACSECGLRRLHPIPNALKQGYYTDAVQLDPAKTSYCDQSAVWYMERADEFSGRVRTDAGGPETPQPVSLLDVGAGQGYYAQAFGRYGMIVTAVEPDPVSLEFAKRHHRNIAHFSSLPLEHAGSEVKGDFDIIFCRHVLEHTSDPFLFLETLRSHCHPKSILILETDNNDSPEVLEHPDASRHWRPYYRNNFRETTLKELKNLKVTALGTFNAHYNSFNKANLNLILEKTGFEVLRLDDYHLGNPILWPNVRSYTNPFTWLFTPGLYRSPLKTLKYRLKQKARPGAGLIVFAKLS